MDTPIFINNTGYQFEARTPLFNHCLILSSTTAFKKLNAQSGITKGTINQMRANIWNKLDERAKSIRQIEQIVFV